MNALRHIARSPASRQRGVGLIELNIAGLVGTLLVAMLLQIALSARSSHALQEAIAENQDSAHFAIDTIGGILRETGFVPEPWHMPVANVGVGAASADESAPRGDRVVLRTWSDRNCFGSLNPERDAAGRPRFYFRESVLERVSTGNLALTCGYGPEPDALVPQISRQGVLAGVEAFQVLYAEDFDGDARADRWVRAGEWSDVRAVIGLQAALLLASREPVVEPTTRTYTVLDQTFSAPADGRQRRVVTLAHAFRSRIR